MSHFGTAPTINGKLEGLVRQRTYPRLSGKEGDETITDVFHSANDENLIVPNYGDFMYDPPLFFKQFNSHRLVSREFEYDDSRQIIIWTLTYECPPHEDSGPSATVSKKVWSLQTQDTELPIETHPNYIFAWNHDLYMKPGEEESVASCWIGSVTGAIPPHEGKTFVWVKDGETCPREGWVMLQRALKPGVQAYRSGIPCAQLTLRSTSKRKLQAWARVAYRKGVPEETFGLDGKQWIRGGANLVKDGRYWVLTTEFQALEKVDEDIYGDGSETPETAANKENAGDKK